MITTHTEALDYCRCVLDECGAPGVVREKIEQRIGDGMHVGDASRPDGCLFFRTDRDLTEQELQEHAFGHLKAQVGYTLPIEPSTLRRRIILNYAPSSIRELAQ